MPALSVLRSRVQDYLIDVPTATSNLIDSWINKAMQEAESRHDFHHMQAEDSGSTTVDTRKLKDLPADWKRSREAPYFLRNDGSTREMAWAVSGRNMRRQFDEQDTDSDGDPEYLLETDTELLVYPFPDGGSDYSDGEYRVRIPYWAKTADLVNDADTNWWTDNAEWFLVFYAAAEGLLFNRDREEAATYFERAEVERQRLVREDKRSRVRQPRQLVPQAGVYGHGRRPPRH